MGRHGKCDFVPRPWAPASVIIVKKINDFGRCVMAHRRFSSAKRRRAYMANLHRAIWVGGRCELVHEMFLLSVFLFVRKNISVYVYVLSVYMLIFVFILDARIFTPCSKQKHTHIHTQKYVFLSNNQLIGVIV